MKIIAHRGAWFGDSVENVAACEKNSIEAFTTASRFRFGIETDFRDICGTVVISHNPPQSDAIKAEDFFRLTFPGQIIAVNVKADGLAQKLKTLWRSEAPEVFPFAFDMSVPDTIGYVEAQFPFFERQSEYEQKRVWDSASGFWLDGFNGQWFHTSDIEKLLDIGNPVCVVSPELHGRSYLPVWKDLENLINENHRYSENLWLCTDRPFEARRFFKDN